MTTKIRPGKILLLILALPLSWSTPAHAADEVSCDSDTTLVKGKSEDGFLAEWCEVRDGVRHGPLIAWFADGRMKIRANYSDGQLDGEYQSWFANGNLEKSGDYSAGKLEGEWTRWYENGLKRDVVYWHAEKPDGAWQSWHEDGRKKAKGRFSDGKETGDWTYWHPNGGKEKEGRYSEGKQICLWNLWDSQGLRSEKEFPASARGCPKRASIWNHFSAGFGAIAYDSKEVSTPYFAFHPTARLSGSWLYFRFTLGYQLSSATADIPALGGPIIQAHLSIRYWYLFAEFGIGGVGFSGNGFKGGPNIKVGFNFDSPLFGFLERVEMTAQELSSPSPFEDVDPFDLINGGTLGERGKFGGIAIGFTIPLF